MVDRFQAHDDDGDAAVTLEEFNDRSGRLVQRMDRNGDGAISADDFRSRRHYDDDDDEEEEGRDGNR